MKSNSPSPPTVCFSIVIEPFFVFVNTQVICSPGCTSNVALRVARSVFESSASAWALSEQATSVSFQPVLVSSETA